MNCTRCGTVLPDNATFCVNCGNPNPAAPPPPGPQSGYQPPGAYGAPQNYAPAPNIPDYLIWSIITTLCCCLPLGIVGIVCSMQAKTAIQLGNYAQAEGSSKTAFYCNLVAWIVGGIGAILYILLIVFGVVAGNADGNFNF